MNAALESKNKTTAPQERRPADAAPVAAPATAPPARAAEAVRVEALRRQAQRNARRQKQLGIAAGLAITAFLFLIYLPSVATLSDLRQRISSDARQLASDRDRAAALPALRAAANLLDEQLTQFQPLPPDPGHSEFVRLTNDLYLQKQLREMDSKPLEPFVEGGLGTFPIRMTFAGNYENVYGLLWQIERLPRLLRIHELTIRPKGGQTPLPGEVAVDMTVHLYYLPPAASPERGSDR